MPQYLEVAQTALDGHKDEAKVCGLASKAWY